MGETRKIIIDGEEVEIEIEIDGDNYRATIEGHTFDFVIPNVKSTVTRKRDSSGSRKKGGTVCASMPGKVVTVEVNIGDLVDEGDTVLILEAMKMQNEVASPIRGTVREIHCQDGMNVEANVPLVVIEPISED
ncbi:MAG: biotin/lipoyl-containing protein [Candidatus Thalassarchaeaceae archaeon]|jgi:biotin carboxyl carrier protein|nr:biotin/lipoyl-containing protein [Candidatus Thalassarchaeaceae archaeon]